jgi:hypothetical protein
MGTLDDLKRALAEVSNAGGESIVVKLETFDLGCKKRLIE